MDLIIPILGGILLGFVAGLFYKPRSARRMAHKPRYQAIRIPSTYQSPEMLVRARPLAIDLIAADAERRNETKLDELRRLGLI